MLKPVKNKTVTFKELCVDDTFEFLCDKYKVVEVGENDVYCYNYREHEINAFFRNCETVTPIECKNSVCSEIKTAEIDNMEELNVGDVFRFVSGWFVFLGKSDNDTLYTCYSFTDKKVTHAWEGNCGGYYKLVDEDVEWVNEY